MQGTTTPSSKVAWQLLRVFEVVEDLQMLQTLLETSFCIPKYHFEKVCTDGLPEIKQHLHNSAN